MSKLKSLIGKKYTPYDNSWSVNVTDCGDILSKAKCSFLAGKFGSNAVECTIVSEPFRCNTRMSGLKESNGTYEMIMVNFNNETHMVLFNKHYVK